MEVEKDHSATPESGSPSVGKLRAATRFAVLALVITIGGYALYPKKAVPDQPDTVVTECEDCDDASTLESGESLIGRRLLVKREGVHNLIVHVVRRNGAVEIDVNGKTYGIQKTLGVAVGKKITAIDMDGGDVKITSEEYGDALVTRAEIERVLGKLADANSQEVTANVDARFTPQPGTVVAASLSMKRWCDDYNGGPESFGVTFELMNPPTTLASRD